MKYLIELGQNFIESFRITESQKKIGEEFQKSDLYPKLLTLPHRMVLDARICELDYSRAELAAEGSG